MRQNRNSVYAEPEAQIKARDWYRNLKRSSFVTALHVEWIPFEIGQTRQRLQIHRQIHRQFDFACIDASNHFNPLLRAATIYIYTNQYFDVCFRISSHPMKLILIRPRKNCKRMRENRTWETCLRFIWNSLSPKHRGTSFSYFRSDSAHVATTFRNRSAPNSNINLNNGCFAWILIWTGGSTAQFARNTHRDWDQ